jgi:peroxiredoxin Q/BCP
MIKEGLTAPDFKLPDQNDVVHTLSDYKGKWVILYFYPKDMTPGCTIEACNFRDDYSKYTRSGVIILGISKDSIKQHDKFIKKHDLPFTLLSDQRAEVTELYGVWKEKSMYGKKYMGIERSTFLIDPRGRIAKIYLKVNVKEHSRELLEALKSILK